MWRDTRRVNALAGMHVYSHARRDVAGKKPRGGTLWAYKYIGCRATTRRRQAVHDARQMKVQKCWCQGNVDHATFHLHFHLPRTLTPGTFPAMRSTSISLYVGFSSMQRLLPNKEFRNLVQGARKALCKQH